MNEMEPHKISGTYIVPAPFNRRVLSVAGTGLFPQRPEFRRRIQVFRTPRRAFRPNQLIET